MQQLVSLISYCFSSLPVLSFCDCLSGLLLQHCKPYQAQGANTKRKVEVCLLCIP